MLHYFNTARLFIHFQKNKANASAVAEEIIPVASSSLLMRRYTPIKARKKHRHSLFLPHGLNHHGHNDPRIIRLARALCSCGYTVYTPHLTSILRYDINFSLTSKELQDGLSYLCNEPTQAPIKIICFSLIASLTLHVTSLSHIAPKIHSIFMLSGYYDNNTFIDYVLFDPKANLFAKFILVKNLMRHQYGVDPKLEAQLLNLICILHATGTIDYKRDLNNISAEAKKLIVLITTANNKKELLTLFNKGIEGLKDACKLHIVLTHARPKISIVHSRDDDIIPSSEAYKLAEALKEQTEVKILVTPLFDHADIKLNLRTVREFVKLCGMLNFI